MRRSPASALRRRSGDRLCGAGILAVLRGNRVKRGMSQLLGLALEEGRSKKGQCRPLSAGCAPAALRRGGFRPILDRARVRKPRSRTGQ
jgi:hypothetical protein